jgi:hypothetical protein
MACVIIQSKTHIKSIQATGRGAAALTRQGHWPAPDFGQLGNISPYNFLLCKEKRMEFSIELASERIYDSRSREHFREVLKAFITDCNSSALVMLWTVVICDLIYKLEELQQVYNDSTATDILKNIEKIQSKDSRSPEWESKLVKMIRDRTQLIDNAEYQEIENLHKYRHLAAHPIIGTANILYKPKKEIVRAYIRNMLENVLLKSPLLTKKIATELVRDIAEKKELFPDDESLKRYIEAKYCKNLRAEIENDLFKTLWKFVFQLSNEDTDSNRAINFRTLLILYSRRPEELQKYIGQNQQYFSQVIDDKPLEFLIKFLSQNSIIFSLLNDTAKIPIKSLAEKDLNLYAMAWFLNTSLIEHIYKIKEKAQQYYKNDIDEDVWQKLGQLAKAEDCLDELLSIGIILYTKGRSFGTADLRYKRYVAPYLADMKEDLIFDLLDGMENNDQIYHYGRAGIGDISAVLEYGKRLLGEKFDGEKYPNLMKIAQYL